MVHFWKNKKKKNTKHKTNKTKQKNRKTKENKRKHVIEKAGQNSGIINNNDNKLFFYSSMPNLRKTKENMFWRKLAKIQA